jgi:hypothetical protein
MKGYQNIYYVYNIYFGVLLQGYQHFGGGLCQDIILSTTPETQTVTV